VFISGFNHLDGKFHLVFDTPGHGHDHGLQGSHFLIIGFNSVFPIHQNLPVLDCLHFSEAFSGFGRLDSNLHTLKLLCIVLPVYSVVSP
jgi:hypothetical protein